MIHVSLTFPLKDNFCTYQTFYRPSYMDNQGTNVKKFAAEILSMFKRYKPLFISVENAQIFAFSKQRSKKKYK